MLVLVAPLTAIVQIHTTRDAAAFYRPEDLDDPVEVLKPRNPRSEAERDRLAAAANYASARILANQSEFAKALTRFQRAWRLDPESVSILQQIVPLAQTLNRHAVAARYATLAAERRPENVDLLTRLGVLLAQQNELNRASRFFEQAIRLRSLEPPDPELLTLYLELGRLRFLLDDYAGAAEPFTQFIQALEHPDRFQLTDEARKTLLRDAELVYEMLGVTFLEVGRLDDAESMFREAESAKPRAGILSYRLAEIAFRRNEISQANALLEEAFRQGVVDAALQPYGLLLKVIAVGEPDQDKSRQKLIDRLRSLRAAMPDNAPLGFFLARQLVESKAWDEAEELYNQLQKQPAADGFRGLVLIHHHKQNAEKLLLELGSAASSTGSIELLGNALQQLVNDDAVVRRVLEAAVERKKTQSEPAKDGVALAGAQLAFAVKDYDLADDLFEWALKTPDAPKARWLMNWGLAMFTAEQPARAAKAFQRALDDNVAEQNTHVFQYYLAGALALAGKIDEAVLFADKAVAGDASSATYHNRAAWILYHAKKYSDAERRYRDFFERFDDKFDSESSRASLREARLVMSVICVTQKRLAEAEDWLEEVLDEFPEDISAFNDLGYLWADQNKNLRRAQAMIERAVAADPNNAAYRDSLGWVYFRLDRFDDAVTELSKAVVDDLPDGVVLDHLAEAYLKRGDRDLALATWRRSGEVFRKDKQTDELLKIESKINMYSPPK